MISEVAIADSESREAEQHFACANLRSVLRALIGSCLFSHHRCFCSLNETYIDHRVSAESSGSDCASLLRACDVFVHSKRATTGVLWLRGASATGKSAVMAHLLQRVVCSASDCGTLISACFFSRPASMGACVDALVCLAHQLCGTALTAPAPEIALARAQPRHLARAQAKQTTATPQQKQHQQHQQQAKRKTKPSRS